MRKTISAAIAVILMLALLATPVLAEKSNGSYGDVPKSADAINIDGVKDGIYDKGLKLEMTRDDIYDEGTNGTTGTAWVLWQDGFLYVFAEIKQGYLQDAGEAEDKQSGSPWEVDSLEVFLDPDNEGENSEQYRVDAWGYRSFENRYTGDNSYGGDATTADGVFEGAARIAGTNYNVEFKIPVTKGAGSQLGFLLQINDMSDHGTRYMIFTSSSNGEAKSWEQMDYDYIALSANEVTNAAPEVVEEAPAPAEAAPAPVAAAPAPSAPAPATADPIVIIALGSLISAAGVVIARKRK